MDWLDKNVEHPLLLILAIGVAIPFLWQFWRWFFGDIFGFAEDVKDAGLPDWYAFLKGRYWEGEWAELKIFVFIGLCIAFIVALYTLCVKVIY